MPFGGVPQKSNRVTHAAIITLSLGAASEKLSVKLSRNQAPISGEKIMKNVPMIASLLFSTLFLSGFLLFRLGAGETKIRPSNHVERSPPLSGRGAVNCA